MLREQEFIIQMYIEGHPITHFLSFHLSQTFNAHHHFELRMEHGKLGLPGLINMQDTGDYIGRKLVVSFGYDEVRLQNFAGIITRVSLSQSDGFQGVVVISGYSASILMDKGADLGSYLDHSLYDIVKTVSRKVASDDLQIMINTSRKVAVDYLIQYKESDFDFLNRLSAEYFEWFYFDGEQLHFGKPDELPEGTLTYGQEIRSLEYGINITPIKQNRFFYDAKGNQMMNSEAVGEEEGSPDLQHALDRSNEMYNKGYSSPISPRIDSYGDLNHFMQYEEKANKSKLLTLKAESDSPIVRLGTVIQIDTSVRQDLSFVKDTLGKFLITSVEHYFDGLGRYSNSFEGIVGNTERIPVKNYTKPSPDLQLADVRSNADPDGQGRVKVQFKWQCSCNDESEWLRVLTPDAGATDQVQQNRGFAFIPEKGDQVIVGFEEGNIARPIVMGSLYHGLSGIGGNVDNHIKSIQTRSGNKVIFNDTEGSIYMEDPSGNTYFMDGKKNITINAPGNIFINAGKDITMTAGENLNINVGNNMNTNVSNDNTIVINQKHQFTSDSYKQTVKGDKKIAIDGKLEETTSSTTHKAKNGDILIQSAGITKILGKIDAKINKG